jgi:hypothetical protein
LFSRLAFQISHSYFSKICTLSQVKDPKYLNILPILAVVWRFETMLSFQYRHLCVLSNDEQNQEA